MTDDPLHDYDNQHNFNLMKMTIMTKTEYIIIGWQTGDL